MPDQPNADDATEVDTPIQVTRIDLRKRPTTQTENTANDEGIAGSGISEQAEQTESSCKMCQKPMELVETQKKSTYVKVVYRCPEPHENNERPSVRLFCRVCSSELKAVKHGEEGQLVCPNCGVVASKKTQNEPIKPEQKQAEVIISEGRGHDNSFTALHHKKQIKQSRILLDLSFRHREIGNRLFGVLYRVSMFDKSQLVTNYLSWVEDAEARLSDFLYEEMCSTLGYYDESIRQIVFDNLPPDLQYRPTEFGFVIENLPKWMLGHSAKIKYPPMFRNDEPFIRKREMWYWLIRKLKNNFLDQEQDEQIAEYGTILTDEREPWRQKSSIPRIPPLYAAMVVIFRSKRHNDIRDIDHYLPPIESVVNALRNNELIRSDQPGYFSLAIEWQCDGSVKQPVVDLWVYTSGDGIESWQGIKNVDQRIRDVETELGKTLRRVKQLEHFQHLERNLEQVLAKYSTTSSADDMQENGQRYNVQIHYAGQNNFIIRFRVRFPTPKSLELDKQKKTIKRKIDKYLRENERSGEWKKLRFLEAKKTEHSWVANFEGEPKLSY